MSDLAKGLLLAIRSKFGHVSRFSVISGIPYAVIVESVRHNREYQLKMIMEKLEECEDRPVGNEMTPELRQEIAHKWADCDQDKIKKEGYSMDWIDSVINGTRRRFVTNKIRRFMDRLDELSLVDK